MNLVKSFKKGYYRPTTLPLWKLLIVYCAWILCLIGYVSAIIYSIWFIIFGIIFQDVAMLLPLIWDTGLWRETEQGKEYIEKYEQD